ncbi:hypothetical protein NT6N_39830 [Oceaniferula spumae]|uniref:NADH-quinone oxidoreductase subunit J n=1 Tax=Oceaniferula spumae TaxID=2979115 RepID=A0AAT9FSG6_9BACT
MISPLFYLFAALMVAGGVMVVLMHNPVSSALSMVLSFVGLAGLFIGLNAYFVGILQILVYAGAIMVLFIFIIMLLDVKKEEKDHWKASSLAAGIAIPAVLLIQLAGVLSTVQNSPKAPELDFKQALERTVDNGDLAYKEDTMIRKRLAADRLPDTHLIGKKLFTDYNFPLQVIAVLLLVATVGCVTLSKKSAAAPTAVTPFVRSVATEDEPAALPKLAETEKPAEKTADKDSPTLTETHERRGLIYTSRPDDVDDLKVISGVGPKLEEKLNEFGIYTYKQVANWSEKNIEEFDDLLSFKGRITRDNWLTQAAELHAKKNA